MLTYKIYLENGYDNLVDEIISYYHKHDRTNEENKLIADPVNGLNDLKDVNHENPYEAYLITQIKLTESLPPVIEEHIRMLNVGDNIDDVLESFELEVYNIKKNIYNNLDEWELLLDHIDDERIKEINSNPKGYGDFLIKELLWLRKCEEKHTR